MFMMSTWNQYLWVALSTHRSISASESSFFCRCEVPGARRANPTKMEPLPGHFFFNPHNEMCKHFCPDSFMDLSSLLQNFCLQQISSQLSEISENFVVLLYAWLRQERTTVSSTSLHPSEEHILRSLTTRSSARVYHKARDSQLSR